MTIYLEKIMFLKDDQVKMRDSNIELLRIICMFGIVSLHTYARYYNTATDITLFYGVFLNSIFNVGVTIFMLISGYFGLMFSTKKAVILWLKTWVYSVLGIILVLICGERVAAKDLLLAMLPVSTSKYWYITVYFFILIFSPFINRIPEGLSRKQFEKLLLGLIGAFWILPTIVQRDLMNDAGKGIANMLTVYLIGRYIKFYISFKKLNKLKWTIGIIAWILFNFLINMLTTFFKGNPGIFAPFARDCSITILVLAAAVFVLFLHIRYYSKIVNFISKHIIAVFFLEGVIRKCLDKFLNFDLHETEWIFLVLFPLYVVLIMGICIVIDIVYEGSIGKWNQYIYKKLKEQFDKVGLNEKNK